MKVGNFVRPADTAPLAVINQMAPVYVTFAIPQRVLVDLREAMATGASKVIATIPGQPALGDGKVAMVENTVDSTTGMVTVRGIMNNENETLWPGILVKTKLIIRTEDAVTVPTVAVQRSQTGNFVFVGQGRQGPRPAGEGQPHLPGHVRDHVGTVRRRGRRVDGQLLLSEGTPVAAARAARPGPER